MTESEAGGRAEEAEPGCAASGAAPKNTTVIAIAAIGQDDACVITISL
jgi:hypothetical protein